MPLGHLVDLIWRWKSVLVYIGAGLIALSILIMYGLIAHTDQLTPYMGVEAWYVTSALLAPVGYVIQDVVADAMTVEAVPVTDSERCALFRARIQGHAHHHADAGPVRHCQWSRLRGIT